MATRLIRWLAGVIATMPSGGLGGLRSDGDALPVGRPTELRRAAAFAGFYNPEPGCGQLGSKGLQNAKGQIVGLQSEC
jgi:hypothetical protein